MGKPVLYLLLHRVNLLRSHRTLVIVGDEDSSLGQRQERASSSTSAHPGTTEMASSQLHFHAKMSLACTSPCPQTLARSCPVPP